MAFIPQLKITEPRAKAKDPSHPDVYRLVAGICPQDIEQFVGLVAVFLAPMIDRTPTEARGMIDVDLGDEQDCRPIGQGTGIEAAAELRAFARIVAAGVAAQFPELVAKRGAA